MSSVQMAASAAEGVDVSGNATSISTRLDRLPVGAFHYKMIAIIGAGLFLDGFELAMASGILGQLVHDGWSNLKYNGYFVTATFLGFMLGCWGAGVIGDRYGRRISYQLNLAIFGGASLLAVFAPNIEILIALRFVMGIGLGAELVLGFSTLAEFVPPAKRGRLVATLSFIAQCGVFFSSLVAMWVIPHLGWRYMFLIAGICAAAVWMMRKFMPESPRWLESKGRFAEADTIVRVMEQASGVASPTFDAAKARATASAANPQGDGVAVHVGIGELFKGGMLRRTVIGIATMCVIQICVYGMVTWLPTFFVQQGFNMVKSLQWSTIMSFGGPVGGLLGLWLADRLGRKPILIGAALLGIVISIVYVQLRVDWLLMLFGFLLLTSFYIIIVVGQAVYMSELFPTRIRMRGNGLCSTISRLVAASIQFVIPALFVWGGVNAIVACVGISLFVFGTIVLTIGVETKSKPLEAIAE